MKNWFKTMLCAVSAATLVACGGGDYVDPNPAAGGGGGGGGATTPEAIAALGAQGFVVANFGIGGAVDGMLIPVAPVMMGPASLETPAAQEPMDISSRCSSGTATQENVEENTYEIVYTNCVGVESDVKYNGTVTVVAVNGQGEEDTDYTVDFDAGLQVSLEIDGTTYAYTYTKRDGAAHAMVLSGIVRDEEGASKVTSLMNVDVAIGTGTITLEEYTLTFDRTVSPEQISINGTYILNLKLSDFGPLPTGVPDMDVPLEFTTSTDPVLTVGDADEFTGGTLILEDARVPAATYRIETNFTTRKLTITVAGQAATYDF